METFAGNIQLMQLVEISPGRGAYLLPVALNLRGNFFQRPMMHRHRSTNRAPESALGEIRYFLKLAFVSNALV